MRVTVADGSVLMSYYYCPKFRWKINGIESIDCFRLVKLEACDMILGGDWIRY